MLIIDTDNTINLTRGDNCDIIVTIYDHNGDEYEIQEGDTVLFTMKINCETQDIVIQKDITSDCIISLTHNDTKSLAYGSYVYDVQLTTAGQEVYTVIAPAIFNITKEVTFNA